MMATPHIDFDPDFAGPAEWAAMYRACGLQVIPCYMPDEAPKGTSWKRPKLSEWAELHKTIAPQATFERWYGPGGEHIRRSNMGVVTGEASGNLLVIDLDEHKTPAAHAWWQALIEGENNGIDPETVEQHTGGGGKQKLFRVPATWRVPTNRTSIGVDIRGQGGFAVMPASKHETGKLYSWALGHAPWEIDIAMAPQWLLDAVEMLVEAHGGDVSGPREVTAGGADFDDFGHRTDGRESYMARVVWAAILDHWRDTPKGHVPTVAEQQLRASVAYVTYESSVKSRLEGPSKTELLEREGRGRTAFWNKWRASMRHWGDRVAVEAVKPKPIPQRDLSAVPESPIDPDTGKPLPLILTAKEFVAGFTPPAYLVDGILQRGYLYSLTARTGHGKTAFSMYAAQAIARGLPMHGRDVKTGTVLLLAGENPDDIRARLLVLAEAYGFEPEQLKMRFIAGVIDIGAQLPVITAAAESIADLVLVIVDTAAAYFLGDDGNSNAQQGAYARLLRRLTFLPGKPAVLVNCHPIKNATQENLLPMGGSAFLNEVDGNLTLWADGERQMVLHWLGKFRGPEFEPISFELRTAESPYVVDAAGRRMSSVVAVPVAESTIEAGEARIETDENRVLEILAANPDISLSSIAIKAGFVNDGRPSKPKVQRVLRALLAYGFVTQHRNKKYRITKKGKDEIDDEG
jgi:Bifunctional DNA primase/polymerase, N-terminal/AAA domain